jgi:pimeloyl-ACP methyl ester carboxylesterase
MARYLYLHGFASGPTSKKASIFRSRFEEAGIRLLVPDLAAGDFENLTITGQLEVIEREAGGCPVRLIGSSMGGYLAALYAARHRNAERLVLLAPAFDFVRRWPDTFGVARFEEWKRAGHTQVLHYGEQAERRLSFALYRDAEGYEPYPEVAAPCLVFHGVRDEVVPADCSREFARRNLAAELRLLDDGHELLLPIEDICARAMQFLA